MHTRREIIKTVATGAAVTAIIKPEISQANNLETSRHEAGRLAENMRRIVGGQWRVTIDQRLEFILISKVL